MARIDQMCAKAVAEGHVPGIVSLVARSGKIVHWKAYGMAENEKNRQLKRDDIFRIASQTKSITSTAVMMLWEEGKFRLDDPISKFIPEFKNPQVLSSFKYSDTTWTATPANKEITIRHLLTHTSGIGYGVIDGDERMKMIYQKAGITDLFTTENITIEENAKKLAKLPLHRIMGNQTGDLFGGAVRYHGLAFSIVSQEVFSQTGEKKPSPGITHRGYPPYLLESGWIPLLNGKDMDGWVHTPDSISENPGQGGWTATPAVIWDESNESEPVKGVYITGDRIVNTIEAPKKVASDIVSTYEFGDMEIYLEFLVANRTNSGVYVHGLYEIQILSSYGRETSGLTVGCIYHYHEPANGQWVGACARFFVPNTRPAIGNPCISIFRRRALMVQATISRMQNLTAFC